MDLNPLLRKGWRIAILVWADRKAIVVQITILYNGRIQKSMSGHTSHQILKWIGYCSRRLCWCHSCNIRIINWSYNFLRITKHGFKECFQNIIESILRIEAVLKVKVDQTWYISIYRIKVYLRDLIRKMCTLAGFVTCTSLGRGNCFLISHYIEEEYFAHLYFWVKLSVSFFS